MKKEWDQRALKNASHFVSSFREEWDDESFYRWGEVQTQAVIDKFFKDLKIDPSNLVILEIGCGAGRMSRALSSRFKLIYAYDVSDEYISISREKNSDLKNVIFTANDGVSFPEINNETIDFVFSGWTMQHMPTKDVVIKNIMEIARVLKLGGLYKIDPPVRTGKLRACHIFLRMVPYIPLLNWKLRMKLTRTYRGINFTENEILEALSRFNLSVNTLVENDGSERFCGKQIMKKWFYGRKEKNTH